MNIITIVFAIISVLVGFSLECKPTPLEKGEYERPYQRINLLPKYPLLATWVLENTSDGLGD